MARKADDADGMHKYGSRRHCNAVFADSLRDWTGRSDDVSKTTRKDWRISSADRLAMRGGEGAFGHDVSLNNADDWKRSSTIYVNQTFSSGLRAYQGESWQSPDAGFDANGHPRANNLPRHVGSGDIYRKPAYMMNLTTVQADQHYIPSLRAYQPKNTSEFLRTRQRHLKLPAYKDLSEEEVRRAQRLFARIDKDESGTIDAAELRKVPPPPSTRSQRKRPPVASSTFDRPADDSPFHPLLASSQCLAALGHKASEAAARELIQQAVKVDEGAPDSRLGLQGFARLIHGLEL